MRARTNEQQTGEREREGEGKGERGGSQRAGLGDEQRRAKGEPRGRNKILVSVHLRPVLHGLHAHVAQGQEWHGLVRKVSQDDREEANKERAQRSPKTSIPQGRQRQGGVREEASGRAAGHAGLAGGHHAQSSTTAPTTATTSPQRTSIKCPTISTKPQLDAKRLQPETVKQQLVVLFVASTQPKLSPWQQQQQ